MYLIGVNRKNIILRELFSPEVTIYNVEKMSGYQIRLDFLPSFQSQIINDILYLIDINKTKIHKYTLLGKYIESIKFCEGNILIFDSEVIIQHNNSLSYYDLEGHKLGTAELDVHVRSFRATTNHVYIIDSLGILSIYDRVF
jgi:hypothetical protein